MTQEEFHINVCNHMKEQTEFLKEINNGMRAVKAVSKFIGTVIGIGSAVLGLFSFFKH